MLFSDVEAFLQAALAPNFPNPVEGQPALVPVIQPQYNAALVKKSPQQLIFATLGSGPGLQTEQTYDRIMLTIRITGRQNDYSSAENLAQWIDLALLGVNGNAVMGTCHVLGVNRTGGPPQPIDYDDADRTNFQCSYVVTAATGL